MSGSVKGPLQSSQLLFGRPWLILSARVEAQSSLDLFMCRNRKQCIDVFKAKSPGTRWFFLVFKCITTHLKHNINQIWRWWYRHVTTMVQSIRLGDITLHGPQGNRKSASCFLFCFQQLLLSFYAFSGATSAPCLIFIFPAIFYIRIVPKDKEPMSSTPKILVRPPPLTSLHFWADWVVVAEHWAPVLLHPPQAACFAALGISFMVMSLSFIIIDWSMGDGLASRGH